MNLIEPKKDLKRLRTQNDLKKRVKICKQSKRGLVDTYKLKMFLFAKNTECLEAHKFALGFLKERPPSTRRDVYISRANQSIIKYQNKLKPWGVNRTKN